MADQDRPTAVVDGYEVEKKAKGKMPKRMIVVTSVIVLMLLVSGWFFWQHRSAKNANAPKCSVAILKEAAPNLGAEKVTQLQKTADKIKKIKGYDTDPNCLYVVLNYSINNGDAGAASDQFKQLQAVYSDKTGFNSSLGFTKSLSLLKSDIAYLVHGQKQAEQNMSTFGNNP